MCRSLGPKSSKMRHSNGVYMQSVANNFEKKYIHKRQNTDRNREKKRWNYKNSIKLEYYLCFVWNLFLIFDPSTMNTNKYCEMNGWSQSNAETQIFLNSFFFISPSRLLLIVTVNDFVQRNKWTIPQSGWNIFNYEIMANGRMENMFGIWWGI